MREEWHRTTVQELIDSGVLALNDGYRTRSDQLDANGIPILRVADVGNGVITPSYKDRIKLSYRDRMGAKISRPGDVIVTTKGTVGRVARIPRDFPEHSYSPQVCFYRSLLIHELDPAWLYSWLRSPEFQTQAGVHKDQTDMAPYLSLTNLRTFQINLPPLPEQRRIAGVLVALDDLIDTNQRLSSGIESLLSGLFAQFKFDAVPAVDDATPLSKLVEVNPAIDKPQGSVPFVDMASLNTSGLRISGYTQRSSASSVRFANGDALMARITPCLENGKAAYVDCLPAGAIASGSTEFIVLRAKGEVPQCWPYFLIRSGRFRAHAVRHMSGTSGRQRCPAKSVADYPVAVPSPVDLRAFGDAATPLMQALTELAAEIEDLRKTRDELLPLLMSGAVSPGEVTVAS